MNMKTYLNCALGYGLHNARHCGKPEDGISPLLERLRL